jgi:AcrR family transcriptional regulator
MYSKVQMSWSGPGIQAFYTFRYGIVENAYNGTGMKQRKGQNLGRPRSFDVEKALDSAMSVFREKGYEGASLAGLTEAMGINRPSMYAAFGDKESLFRRVLERYSCGVQKYFEPALAERTVRGFVERLLRTSAELQTQAGTPRGCLITQGALVCAEGGEPIRQALISLRHEQEAMIRRRLQRGKREGDLPENANPSDLARYLTAVMQGMAVLATGGAGRAELRKVAETALAAFPAKINPARRLAQRARDAESHNAR